MAPYLTKYKVATIATRGESINVACLLLAAVTLKFWKGKPLRAYTEKFIQAVSPKLVITFIDNNIWFYCISKRFPDVKTIFIQNGFRSVVNDVFGGRLVKSENYHVDHMLVFSAQIGLKPCLVAMIQHWIEIQTSHK